MNILFVAELDYASVAYHLAEALRQHGHQACSIVEHAHKYELPFDYAIDKGFTKTQYKKLLNDAQVVVNTSGYAEYRPFSIPYPRDKVLCLWNGGTNYRQNHYHYNNALLPCFDVCYAHSDLAGLSDRNHVLEQPIDTNKYRFMKRRLKERITIGHTPSSPEKGSFVIEQASPLLQTIQEPEIRFMVTTGNTWERTMHLRREFDFYFDQVLQQFMPRGALRGYGCAAIESACLGTVILTGHDTDAPFRKVFSGQEMYSTILEYIDDPELYLKDARLCRDWVEKRHSYAAVVEQFLKPLEGKV